MRGRIEGEQGGIDMKQSEMISYAEQRRKNRKSSPAKKPETQTSLINGNSAPISAAPVKKEREVMTLFKGKPSLSTDFDYDRTLFNQENTPREEETAKQWSIKRKQQAQLQKPPPKMVKKYDAASQTYVNKPSTAKRFPIDPTTNKSLEGVITEGDHIASLFTVQQMVTPPSYLSTDFVKNKWKVREGGTEKLSPKQMQSLYLTDHIQMTSKKVNRAKGAKRIADYRKEGGWGAEGLVSRDIAVKQARGYHDSLLSVAKEFGKRGGFSREDAQAYREIVGEDPNPLLDGSDPAFSPPSTKSNITGFDAYNDKIRQSAADAQKERKKAQKEWEGEIPSQPHLPVSYPAPSKPKKQIAQKVDKPVQAKKEYELSPKKQWRRLKGTKKWEKVPGKAKTSAAKPNKWKKAANTSNTKKKKVDVLKKMFPGIDGVKGVKNKNGVLVTERVANIKRKTRYTENGAY